MDFGDEERIYPLQQLLPELASYDAGTLNWQNRTVFMNPPHSWKNWDMHCRKAILNPKLRSLTPA